MTRGQRIKAARKSAGLTQRELGEKLGVAYQTLAQWENDLRNPKYETLRRIADALGCDWLDLVTPEEGAQAIVDHIHTKATAETYMHSRIEHSLGPTGFAKLLSEQLSSPQGRITAALDKLNEEGQEKAADAVELIAEIPRYRAEPAPESTPASQKGNDTTPPPDVPEAPAEGK